VSRDETKTKLNFRLKTEECESEISHPARVLQLKCQNLHHQCRMKDAPVVWMPRGRGDLQIRFSVTSQRLFQYM
jgi:hypothetical protein